MTTLTTLDGVEVTLELLQKVIQERVLDAAVAVAGDDDEVLAFAKSFATDADSKGRNLASVMATELMGDLHPSAVSLTRSDHLMDLVMTRARMDLVTILIDLATKKST